MKFIHKFFYFSSRTKESLTYSAYGTPSSEITETNKQATKHSRHLQNKSKRSGHTTRAKAYKKDEYV